MNFKVTPVVKNKDAASLGQLFDAVNRVGQGKLKEAFQNNPFIYGTQGTGNKMIMKALHRLNERKNVAPGDKDTPALATKIGRTLNLFAPGDRVKALVANNYQMMDMYYGQAGNALHTRRHPAIAEFVHYAMGFEGKFSFKESGRDAYMRTFGTKIEGWDERTAGHSLYIRKGGPNEPRSATHLTTTKEISRIIRWAIQQLGGTLIFEGRELYYCQVFEENPARVSDTDLEARNLFKYFKPGLSTTPFGTGRLVFHWDGIETVPTQLHFRSNWRFSKPGETHADGNFETTPNVPGLSAIWKNFDAAPKDFGGTNPTKLLLALKMAKAFQWKNR